VEGAPSRPTARPRGEQSATCYRWAIGNKMLTERVSLILDIVFTVADPLIGRKRESGASRHAARPELTPQL